MGCLESCNSNPCIHDSILKESLWDAVDGYNLPLLEFLLENQSSRFKELVGQDFGQISEKIFSSSSSTKSQDLQDAFEAHEQRFSEQNPVNQRNDQGQTLLMKAADRVDSRIVQMLLERQADPNLTDNDGNSALIIASSTNWNRVIYSGGELTHEHEMMITKRLCQARADVHQRNQNRDYPLKKAIESENFYIARVLYTFGASLEESDLALWSVDSRLKLWKQGYDDARGKKYTPISELELAAYSLDPFKLHRILPVDRRAYFEGMSWFNPEYWKSYLEKYDRMSPCLDPIKSRQEQTL